MKSNWSTTMELVTICMGVSIVALGVSYLMGGAILPPALVTGISIAGFCLTLSDYFIKVDVKNNWFVNTESRKSKLVIFMHFTAVYGVMVFPNMRFIEDIGKGNLEFISTVASVIALGFVIVVIGHNNRKEVINDITVQFQWLKDNQKSLDELKKQVPELKKELNETKEQLLQRDKEIEQLQLRLEQLNKN
ncbi:hypothetical protein [Bacillus cereus]|uniref:hypothetical protein n=1 Tax=Bacillus cereus TaxID=1396 RepID=UPI0011AAF471|nr:hypothetical protein [Bacillus cereus]